MKELKKTLRTRLRAKRLSLPLRLNHFFSKQITDLVIRSPEFRQAKHIAIYQPMFGEVSTEWIKRFALLHHKACYLPILDKQRLVFGKLTNKSSFVPNRYGILEPNVSLIIPAQHLDLVLLPLVAFDRHCHRLGMGGGFYDRTFHFKRQSHRPKLVGLAYEFQKVARIPKTELDISLDAIVTEKRWYFR